MKLRSFKVLTQIWFTALLSCALNATVTTSACTIFVLTDEHSALFCNNEDWSDPKTQIWFNSNKGKYGCAFVGFDNGWAQGGMNSEGLAFDWVAGYKEQWEPKSTAHALKGNPAQRMLESCATVEEAISFFQDNREPSFSYAKVMVADRNGTSAIIGAKDGKLEVVKAKASGGFGYKADVVRNMLAENSAVSVDHAANILKASQQEGQYATKYSNIFDLKSGRILIYQFGREDQSPTVLDLKSELAKGPHYYDLPKIKEQYPGKGKKLTRGMKKF